MNSVLVMSETDSDRTGSAPASVKSLKASAVPLREDEIASRTDAYFRATKTLVENSVLGLRDEEVTYAVFFAASDIGGVWCGNGVA